ncbi:MULTISPECIES: sporulation membrane protein YtaF [unclassified Bacillus (in: firmicutes)]|uniref:sporulation membrane protein YtaF n=1 Tax=unclassified Bacillus (in: firmicutes) TaxID=185979 RepID=UPI000BF13A32|nr:MULTISPECIES: sporulation membrane protein YtaF [unclassified Bacillus (in: firmicutes)]PEJ58224.1 sporulation membrane protein YtaF [Bacillus sp. AFS002410]PEL12100.1 sporulation membrane protein YtaF [Bacillus sp. AFS017336]
MQYSIWFTVLFLAFSSSIDNFGVGITYGIRGIKVGILANLIISIIAFIFSEAGIVSGQYISKVFPGTLSNVIGAFFLLVIGLRIVLLTIPRKNKEEIINDHEDESNTNGLTNYLSSPEKADVDHSGDISSFEAIILGTAVSMNALTNGLGVGLIGLSPFAISIAASIFSFVAIWLGVLLGKKVANVKIGGWSLGQFSSIISGIILVLIAIHNLL